MKLIGEIRRHPAVATMVAGLSIAILVNAAIMGDLGRALLYFVTLAISLAAIEIVLGRWPAKGPATIVRGATGDLIVFGISWLVGMAWLWARFVRHYQPPPGPARLVSLFLVVFCVFNALPALWLIARRYGLRGLGLGISGVQAAPIVIVIFALASTIGTPGSITWSEIEKDAGGSVFAIVITALTAAVPEEFFRFAWQTRLGEALSNRATGWLVASILWAALHGPKDWDDSHSIASTVMGVIDIIPLGLLWGYLTHRTRSFIPSVLLHGTNIWGLQNLS